ncbi:MAG: DMT family transporter [Phycisphaerales bacterium]|nr:DMT family transporter [Phycisphaerales bacterium]
MTRSRVLRADALLLLLAIIWGSGFIAQKSAMIHIGPMTFITIRLMLGTAFIAPWLFLRKRSAPLVPTRFRTLLPILLGVIVAVFLGNWLQQTGLVTTEAGTTGFITSLYVVFTPLLGLLIGYRVRLMTWLAILIAVVGLFLVTVAGRPVLNSGDLLILLCAIAWGAQILFVGWLVPRMDPIQLTFIQLCGAALVSLLITPFFETISLESILAAKWDLLYSGLVASGLALMIQVFAQRNAPPAHAAILLSLEAVFAVLFGWWLLDEVLTTIQFIGCGVMFIAIVIAEIKPPRQLVPRSEGD